MTSEPNPSRPSLHKNSPPIRPSEREQQQQQLTHPGVSASPDVEGPPPNLLPSTSTSTSITTYLQRETLLCISQEHANRSIRPPGLSTRCTVTCLCVRSASGSPPAYSSKPPCAAPNLISNLSATPESVSVPINFCYPPIPIHIWSRTTPNSSFLLQPSPSGRQSTHARLPQTQSASASCACLPLDSPEADDIISGLQSAVCASHCRDFFPTLSPGRMHCV
jgi:hypothetical protein